MERFISHDEIFEMQKRNRQEIDFAHRVNRNSRKLIPTTSLIN